jgi:ribonuclease HI
MKIIYCDGSSLGNPGRGGWGVVAIDTEKKLFWEYGGNADNATNNQMELSACIFALKLILKSADNGATKTNAKELKYELRLDSKYVIQGTTEWMSGWVKNGWKNSQKKTVLNKELWQEILLLKKEIEKKKIKIIWTHVYGHTGVEWNEKVDTIAKAFASKENIDLRKGESYK